MYDLFQIAYFHIMIFSIMLYYIPVSTSDSMLDACMLHKFYTHTPSLPLAARQLYNIPSLKPLLACLTSTKYTCSLSTMPWTP